MGGGGGGGGGEEQCILKGDSVLGCDVRVGRCIGGTGYPVTQGPARYSHKRTGEGEGRFVRTHFPPPPPPALAGS